MTSSALAYEAAFIMVESSQGILNPDKNEKAEFTKRRVFP